MANDFTPELMADLRRARAIIDKNDERNTRLFLKCLREEREKKTRSTGHSSRGWRPIPDL